MRCSPYFLAVLHVFYLLVPTSASGIRQKQQIKSIRLVNGFLEFMMETNI